MFPVLNWVDCVQGIHDLVLEMFEDTTVKLGHVLPQFSQDGGIVMQVNGTLSRKVNITTLAGKRAYLFLVLSLCIVYILLMQIFTCFLVCFCIELKHNNISM